MLTQGSGTYNLLPTLPLEILTTAFACIFFSILNHTEPNEKNPIIKGWKYRPIELFKSYSFCVMKNADKLSAWNFLQRPIQVWKRVLIKTHFQDSTIKNISTPLVPIQNICWIFPQTCISHHGLKSKIKFMVFRLMENAKHRI